MLQSRVPEHGPNAIAGALSLVLTCTKASKFKRDHCLEDPRKTQLGVRASTPALVSEARVQEGREHGFFEVESRLYFRASNTMKMTSLQLNMNSVLIFVRTHLTSLIATTVILAIIVVAYRDYRSYVAMGPHGLPDTFWGWRRQLKMSKFARKDVTVPAPYDFEEVAKLMGSNARSSFLAGAPLPQHAGSRPRIPGFVAPQRQTSDVASEEMKNKMRDYLKSLVEANPKTLQFDLSRLEGPVPAVQLQDSVEAPTFLKPTKGEIIHVHPHDGSTHLVLSLFDSATVIKKGWGQRHRLSGGLLPWSYTLVYAPRTEEELAVWRHVVNAAGRFCSADLGSFIVPRQD